MCCSVLYCTVLCYEKCPHLQTGASMSPEPSAPGHRHQQLLASLDAGEVLPEADIVSNILDKLERNLRTASSLLAHTQPGQETEHFLEAEAGQQGATLSRALELFRRLYLHLGRAESRLVISSDNNNNHDAKLMASILQIVLNRGIHTLKVLPGLTGVEIIKFSSSPES